MTQCGYNRKHNNDPILTSSTFEALQTLRRQSFVGGMCEVFLRLHTSTTSND